MFIVHSMSKSTTKKTSAKAALPLVFSKAMKTYRQISNGTLLQCECGWRGMVREALYLHVPNRTGDIVARYYLCRRDMKVLLEDKQSSVIPLWEVDQTPGYRNVNGPETSSEENVSEYSNGDE